MELPLNAESHFEDDRRFASEVIKQTINEYCEMTSYSVQFVMPVDNPVNKVAMKRSKHHMMFEVPLNYPEAHNLCLRELLDAAERSGLLVVSTTPNKNRLPFLKKS